MTSIVKKNIFLKDSAQLLPYISPSSGGGKPRIPKRNPYEHANFLRQKFEQVRNMETEEKSVVGFRYKNGLYLEFIGEKVDRLH